MGDRAALAIRARLRPCVRFHVRVLVGGTLEVGQLLRRKPSRKSMAWYSRLSIFFTLIEVPFGKMMTSTAKMAGAV